MNLQRNIDLKNYNSLAVAATAEYFVSVENTSELFAAVKYAKQHQLAITVIGGGSNIVLAESLSGLVIQLNSQGVVVSEQGDEAVITVQAGENWHNFVMYCVQQGYYGLENLALIPGRVGAAAIQNIGAYGVELSDVLLSLKGLDIDSGEWRELSKAQCQLAYRDSIFKGSLQDKFIITELCLKLSKSFHANIGYQALQQFFQQQNIDQPSAQQVADAVIAIRSSKLPLPEQLPNAGSFFKNPVITHSQCQELLKQHPQLVYYPLDTQHVKLAAGWLIEQLGWKGKSLHGVAMHQQQALVLINQGGSGKDIINYAQQVKDSVYQHFQVTLEIEPRIYC
ncbi:UDP-N-acetylmuramate dehydrogenase [Dasania sp. GY-MA-18]|uniref:UDP-N-acetylenolpyruvoylglucosamine reductase n=1 Tax=Dasania phycosphaerae TaxID=2950436 RepID=A0A9J6RI10_9GAMM|nr:MULTISPECIES: UDP-N-acetylmuramate dehydrogenase [Dasania]MCR8921890.1 UDP-N-acetylmuramate dehydrogenase [Dasania sp. GY-MA-18]MCZ0864318.1 UDP-N-acetylmuramate dehydrogenase [Dasania phycosphaerae]MCZ0868046.1 UDP-N-acetylmuramate dehydrogenase [Dasania phycosphaerae]